MGNEIVSVKTALIISEKSRVGIERAKQDSMQIWGWLNQPHLSHGSRENYERIVRQFFSFHWNIGIKEITTPHVTLFLKSLSELSDASQNLARAGLSSLFRHLEFTGYITRNPVSAIKAKKIYANIEGKVLPREAISRLIEFEPSWRNKLLLKSLYFGGFRESEVIQITPSSIVLIPDGRSKVTILGKGKKTRLVHLPPDLTSELLAFAKTAEIRSNQYIFSSKDDLGKSISRQQVFRVVKAAARRAKVDPVPSPHWFRHSSSMHAYENGASLKEIQETLGHSSLATTQIYLGNRSMKSNGDYLSIEKAFPAEVNEE